MNQGEVWDCIIGTCCFLLAIPNFIQSYTDWKRPRRSKTGQLNKLIHTALWITSLLLALGSFIMANYERYPRLAAVSYSFNEIAAGIYTFALTQICLNTIRSMYGYVHLNRGMPRWQVWGLWSLNILCVALWILAMFAMTLGGRATSWKSGSYFTNACVLLALSSLLIFSKWTLRHAEAQIRAAQRRTNETSKPWYKRKPDTITLLIFFTCGLFGWIAFQTWRIWTHKEGYFEYDTKKYAVITAVMARAIGLGIVSITSFFFWDSSQVEIVFPRLSRFTRQTVNYIERLSIPSTVTSSKSEQQKSHPTPSQPSRETRPFLPESDGERKSAQDSFATPTHKDETRVSLELELQSPSSKASDPSPEKVESQESQENQPMLTDTAQKQTTTKNEEDTGEEQSDIGSITKAEKLLFTTSASSSTILSPSQELVTQEESLTPSSQRTPRAHQYPETETRSSDELSSS